MNPLSVILISTSKNESVFVAFSTVNLISLCWELRVDKNELYKQMNYTICLYKQIDGVTMGSPLGPTLANFFLGQLEEKYLLKIPRQNPNFTCGMLMMFTQFSMTMIPALHSYLSLSPILMHLGKQNVILWLVQLSTAYAATKRFQLLNLVLHTPASAMRLRD